MNSKIFKRIGELRDAGRTWQEVADIVNDEFDQDYTESAYRKPYVAYQQGQVDQITDKEIIKKLERIDIEKKKLSFMRGAHNETVRDLSIREAYHEQIIDAIDKLPKINVKEQGDNYSDGGWVEPVFFLSDFHIDGTFDAEEIMSHIVTVICSHVEATTKKATVERIKIIEVGDTIEGASLRPSQMRAIKLGMTDQIIYAAELYANMLAEITNRLDFLDYVEFYSVTSSNHTQLRLHNSKRDEITDEDLMRQFAFYLNARLANFERIHLHSGEELLVHLGRNYHKRLFVSHGHRYKMTPSSVRSVPKQIAEYHSEVFDYYAFGHFHQFMDVSIDRRDGFDGRIWLLPALSPRHETYERLNLFGANPGFLLAYFDEDGEIIYTRKFPTPTSEFLTQGDFRYVDDVISPTLYNMYDNDKTPRKPLKTGAKNE